MPKKGSKEAEKIAKAKEKFGAGVHAAKEVVTRMDADKAWDSLQSRDLPPEITEYVCKKLIEGMPAGEVAQSLGMRVQSTQWRKVQAFLRSGFRGDAEVFLYRETNRFYALLEKARAVLDEAFEKGTPHVVTHKTKDDSWTEVIYVKGATKELGAFIKNYSDAIGLPVKLWKDYGAIGERKDVPQGTTINVYNNIPLPSFDEIEAHKKEVIARAKAIEVKGEKIE